MNEAKAEVRHHHPKAHRAKSRTPSYDERGVYRGFPHEIRVPVFSQIENKQINVVIGSGETSAAAWNAALAAILARVLLS